VHVNFEHSKLSSLVGIKSDKIVVLAAKTIFDVAIPTEHYILKRLIFIILKLFRTVDRRTKYIRKNGATVRR